MLRNIMQPVLVEVAPGELRPGWSTGHLAGTMLVTDHLNPLDVEPSGKVGVLYPGGTLVTGKVVTDLLAVGYETIDVVSSN